MVVDTVAIHGAIAKSNERIRIEAAIPEGTRKLIRTQFYRELSAEIGEAAMQRLVSAGPIEELENSLLGFGENPIAITMEKRGIGADSNVRLTFGTMNGRTVGESYFVSQELALQTFKDAFPELDRRGFN